MYTDTTTQKEKPTGSGHSAAGYTDSISLTAPLLTIKSKLIHCAAWLALVLGGLA